MEYDYFSFRILELDLTLSRRWLQAASEMWHRVVLLQLINMSVEPDAFAFREHLKMDASSTKITLGAKTSEYRKRKGAQVGAICC